VTAVLLFSAANLIGWMSGYALARTVDLVRCHARGGRR
jgi:hypothetical protein